MHTFTVWAPFAKKLEVVFDGAALAMEGPDERWWWRAVAPNAGSGTEYGFRVDDGARTYPDPRSQSQAHGVHGLSRVYDQGAFPWTDASFKAPALENGVVYEVHIGALTREGTLDAAIANLDSLAELGITHVELMPVAAFPGRHGWGYDGVALFAVHQPYGGPDALKRFVDAAHARGLAVLLDVVYNHFGPVGNYTGKFGPYVTDAHHTPWGGAVNLEGAWSDEVRRFFLDNAQMWMRDYHIDGLRLDAVHAFVDRSAVHFLEQLAAEADALEAALDRRLVLIAESSLNDPRVVTPRDAGGFGIDAQWNDDFQHALFAAVSRGRELGYYVDFGAMRHVKKALEETFVLDGVYSRYRRRVHGRPARHLAQNQFLGYIQNHDQVGNRAVGDRIHACAGFDRAKVAAALVLTAPFVPLIFQGEEWAASAPFQFFADHDDPDIARSVREGRRREFAAFGWDANLIPDPGDPETFQRSKLNWAEASEDRHAEMRSWYRDLIRLRRTAPSLNDAAPGRTRVECDDERRWLRMTRGGIEVICNFGDDAQRFAVPNGTTLRLSSRPEVEIEDSVVVLPPDTALILERGET
jgi:maltooligosyltrehalose trehalohydrolase